MSNDFGIIRSFATTMFFVVFVMSISVGQQSVQYSQFMLNQYGVNAAYGGLESSLSITSGLRSQWGRFEGSPKTQFINAHLPLYGLSGSAGISIENEILGPLDKVGITVSYNYVSELPFGLVSIGAKLGMSQVRIDGSSLVTPTGFYLDNSVNHNDPILLSTEMSGTSPIYGFGIYTSSVFGDLGIIMDNLPVGLSTSGSAEFKHKQLFSLFYSYDITLIPRLEIMPVILIKSDFNQTQTDIGSIMKYDNVFGGVTVRGYNSNSLDAMSLIGGVQLNKYFRVSYSFDFGISDLRSFHDGTHEFVVNYNLNKKIKTGELPKIIYNPRYN